MKLRFPNYYKKFRCIAEKCSDNCCIGWEIDIDEKTAEFYSGVQGDFGERLRRNIKNGSFVLCGERCAFLNDRNLCDIYTELGEEHLCAICAEHPRYYGWYGDIKEGGIGLCCEEAARIILSESESGFYETEICEEESEEVEEDLLAFLRETREEIFRFMENGSVSFSVKLCSLLDYAEKIQNKLDIGEFSTETVEIADVHESEADIEAFISAFYDFEVIDESWSAALDALSGKKPMAYEQYLTNICEYFIWRYFLRACFDEDVISKVQVAAVSAVMISIMADSDSLESYINASKLYSKEIEYSEENMELLMEMCYTEPAFSIENLKSLVIL